MKMLSNVMQISVKYFPCEKTYKLFLKTLLNFNNSALKVHFEDEVQ